MMTFIVTAGFFVMLAIGVMAYRWVSMSAKEPPDESRIQNIGDINKNNTLGSFGVDGL